MKVTYNLHGVEDRVDSIYIDDKGIMVTLKPGLIFNSTGCRLKCFEYSNSLAEAFLRYDVIERS